MRTFVILFLSLFTGFLACADDTFTVTVKGTDTQRTPPPLRVFLGVGQMKFTFLTPDGFRVREDSLMQRVLMEGISKDCNVILRRSLPLDEGTTHRETLLARYAGSKITGESSKKVAGTVCPMYDLQWSKDGIIHSARVIFVSTGAGPLEITAVGTVDVTQSLNTVLSTFLSSDEDGKLVIPTMCDQT